MGGGRAGPRLSSDRERAEKEERSLASLPRSSAGIRGLALFFFFKIYF